MTLCKHPALILVLGSIVCVYVVLNHQIILLQISGWVVLCGYLHRFLWSCKELQCNLSDTSLGPKCNNYTQLMIISGNLCNLGTCLSIPISVLSVVTWLTSSLIFGSTLKLLVCYNFTLGSSTCLSICLMASNNVSWHIMVSRYVSYRVSWCLVMSRVMSC